MFPFMSRIRVQAAVEVGADSWLGVTMMVMSM